MREAFAASDASIVLAIDSGHPSNIALANGWAMFLHLCAQDIEALRTLTSKLLAICKENEFPHWLAVVKIGRGWWLARTGHPHDGLEQLQAGVEEFRSFAGGYLLPAWLVCFADALRIAGRFADARAALDSSLDMIERLNERLWEAENCRMQGEVARDEGDLSAALTAFSRAITVARHQSARSLELRAALAWAKVAAAQGRRAEARELLAPVYGWFTERFDTADLNEAKALLDELT
jgi:predicted ATPase